MHHQKFKITHSPFPSYPEYGAQPPLTSRHSCSHPPPPYATHAPRPRDANPAPLAARHAPPPAHPCAPQYALSTVLDSA